MNYFISSEEKSFVEQQYMVGTLTGNIDVYFSDNAFIYFLELVISQAPDNSISRSWLDLLFKHPVFGKYNAITELNALRINHSVPLSANLINKLISENEAKINQINTTSIDLASYKDYAVSVVNTTGAIGVPLGRPSHIGVSLKNEKP